MALLCTWPCFALGIKSELLLLVSFPHELAPICLSSYTSYCLCYLLHSALHVHGFCIYGFNQLQMLSRNLQKAKLEFFLALATIYIALGNLEMI